MGSLCALVLGVGSCTHPAPKATSVAPVHTVATTPAAPPADSGSTAATPSLPNPVVVEPPTSQAVSPPLPPAATASEPVTAKVRARESRTAAAQPIKPSVVASAAETRPTTPTLDLAALEQRLRDTHAVGVFTKLSLKNQVDDLLDQFRELYRSQPRGPLTPLRQRYDLLLLKVLTLLQDGDPPLATAIASSREAIWAILADPQKFASI